MESRIILVPLDGSAASEATIPYAVALAKANHAALRLLRVLTNLSQHSIFQSPEEELAAFDRLHDEAQTQLDRPAATLRRQGVEVSTAIATGNPAEEILREADKACVIAIVMATHGRGGVERWAVGSVADKVMRISDVPTLLVRPTKAGEALPPIALRTILLPLDGSPLAETAIGTAADLAQATGAELLVLRVEPYLSQMVALAGDGYYTPDLSDIEDQSGAAAQEYMKRVCAQFGEGLHYRGYVERGFPHNLLEPFIREHHVDLVVMSTHGRGGLARFVIGSTADRLVRAGVPCLLIHPASVPERLSEPTAVPAKSY